MTLMLDPTQTADVVEDETQSLHAWSQEDDPTDVVEYRPRSWRMPLLITAAAVAAICTAGVVYEVNTAVDGGATNPLVAPAKPQGDAPAKPSIAPSPPIQVQSPDQRFIAMFKARGGNPEPGREMVVADQAHQVCTALTSRNEDALVDEMLAKSPGINRYTAQLFADTAIDVYCPQYSPTK